MVILYFPQEQGLLIVYISDVPVSMMFSLDSLVSHTMHLFWRFLLLVILIFSFFNDLPIAFFFRAYSFDVFRFLEIANSSFGCTF